MAAGERALAVVSLDGGGPELALGTRHGVVKRVNPELLSRDCWEVITLKGDDVVIGLAPIPAGRPSPR
mgnify:CR=1 FL=1